MTWRIRLSDDAGTVPAWSFGSREEAEKRIRAERLTMSPSDLRTDARWRSPEVFEER